jgi:uncharacterized UBP type Zn finger protein
MNAVIQCLFNASKSLDIAQFNNSDMSELGVQYQKLFDIYRCTDEQTVISPSNVYQAVQDSTFDFPPGPEHDATDFCRFLLENICRPKSLSQESLLNMLEINFNQVRDCGCVRDTKTAIPEPFWSFDLASGDFNSATATGPSKHLQELVSDTKYNSDTTFTCEVCSQSATLSRQVASFGSTIIMFFKRFYREPTTGMDLKVKTPVVFPRTITTAGVKCLLSGLVLHIGKNIAEGHYIACLYDQRATMLIANDASLSVAEIQFGTHITEFEQTNCVLAFYTREV